MLIAFYLRLKNAKETDYHRLPKTLDSVTFQLLERSLLGSDSADLPLRGIFHDNRLRDPISALGKAIEQHPGGQRQQNISKNCYQEVLKSIVQFSVDFLAISKRTKLSHLSLVKSHLITAAVAKLSFFHFPCYTS